ncbi:hypothetical protein NE865_00302 [Phthorimaea operculella]|nr:hypothetical protein NE865_00302 [Phthorimaea operculella]
MNSQPVFILLSLFLLEAHGVRLQKLFQLIDGYKSNSKLRGFLHLGYDYAVFLRKPLPHDKFLVYELYEAKKIGNADEGKPRILAISKVPIDYIKEQLRTYRDELYRAKYIDDNVVPGTQVATLREWQIEKALNFKDGSELVLRDRPEIVKSPV